MQAWAMASVLEGHGKRSLQGHSLPREGLGGGTGTAVSRESRVGTGSCPAGTDQAVRAGYLLYFGGPFPKGSVSCREAIG